MVKYKTPAIGALMEYLYDEYPLAREGLLRLEAFAADILLCESQEECFVASQKLKLISGGEVAILWDVEYLMNYSMHQPERLRVGAPYEIDRFSKKVYSKVLHESCPCTMVVPYTVCGVVNCDIKYVFVIDMPYLDVCCIIDGSHYFYEALIENKAVRYFRIKGEEALLFLTEEGRKFLMLCEKLQELIFLET